MVRWGALWSRGRAEVEDQVKAERLVCPTDRGRRISWGGIHDPEAEVEGSAERVGDPETEVEDQVRGSLTHRPRQKDQVRVYITQKPRWRIRSGGTTSNVIKTTLENKFQLNFCIHDRKRRRRAGPGSWRSWRWRGWGRLRPETSTLPFSLSPRCVTFFLTEQRSLKVFGENTVIVY